MVLFQFLVAKLGIPAVAFFAGTKFLKAWKDQKVGTIVGTIIIAGFIIYFMDNPESVLRATNTIWSKVLEVFK